MVSTMAGDLPAIFFSIIPTKYLSQIFTTMLQKCRFLLIWIANSILQQIKQQ